MCRLGIPAPTGSVSSIADVVEACAGGGVGDVIRRGDGVGMDGTDTLLKGAVENFLAEIRAA